MKQYHFIIIGSGASGLSLAYQLVNSPLRNSSMLVVDRSKERNEGNARNERNDHTWAFWTKTPTLFDAATSRSWHQLLIATDCRKRILELGPYRYKVIRGADFYHFAHDTLLSFPNVAIMKGSVERIEDAAEGAIICVDGQEYEGRWVFDSRFSLADFHPDPLRYRYLKMQFRGWEIETPTDRFDPQTPTFLDFRTPQKGQMRFFYMLPYSHHRALIEYVACTKKLLHKAEQEQVLAAYTKGILNIEDYQVVAEEQGISPMTDYRFPRRTGRHIMSIGIPAGMLKPTTGFAFTRIQRDSAAIVRSLLECGHPFGVPPSQWGYRLFDSLLLRAMEGHGRRIGSLLTFLFEYGSTEHIFRFLDEGGAPI